jgi:hypothetical protein
MINDSMATNRFDSDPGDDIEIQRLYNALSNALSNVENSNLASSDRPDDTTIIMEAIRRIKLLENQIEELRQEKESLKLYELSD